MPAVLSGSWLRSATSTRVTAAWAGRGSGIGNGAVVVLATVATGAGQPPGGALDSASLLPSAMTRNSPAIWAGTSPPLSSSVVNPDAVTARPLRVTEAR